MSSTNRGYKRHKSDYYITPIEKIIGFLNEFNKYESILQKKDVIILDPCAGGDTKNPMSYPMALKKIGISENQIKTIDIREDSRADIKADYLTYQLDYQPDVIITNPPFLLARDIIEKALSDVVEGGFVIMLLRLNYYGGKLRRDLWKAHMPKYTFVHHRRMSFTDDGKTDSIEYAHFVWQKGFNPEFAQLKVI